MEVIFKTVNSSKVTISELMLPSHTNFSGKIHGGYILSLLDQMHLPVLQNTLVIIVLQPLLTL